MIWVPSSFFHGLTFLSNQWSVSIQTELKNDKFFIHILMHIYIYWYMYWNKSFARHYIYELIKLSDVESILRKTCLLMKYLTSLEISSSDKLLSTKLFDKIKIGQRFLLEKQISSWLRKIRTFKNFISFRTCFVIAWLLHITT